MRILPTLAVAVFVSHPLLAQNPDPTQLIEEMEVAVGGWEQMYALHDVQYQYLYEYPGTGKKDVSVERYLFEGEHSWAKYTQHDINVMPSEGGVVMQSLVNGEAACMHNGQQVMDAQTLQMAGFLRRANYFWFTMMFKLGNPGAQHEYLGQEMIGGVDYHKVSVSFDAAITGKEVNDQYVLYINPKTHLVDEFYFSLPANGVTQPMIKMELTYEKRNGLLLHTTRKIYMPGNDGKLSEEPVLVQKITDVQFQNGFSPNDFKL